MKDFSSKCKVAAHALELPVIGAEHSENVSLGLRALLDKELAQDIESRKDRRKMLGEREPVEARSSNREWLQHAEIGMQVVRQHGFSLFRPRRVAVALQPGETLYFPRMATRSGEVRERACIANTAMNQRWLVLPENEDEHGRVQCPVWHVVVDFGPVGIHGLMYLKNGLSLRMTVMPDRLHQLMCCWTGGVSDACLMLRRLDTIVDV